MKFTLKGSKISLNNIHESILPQAPPWIIKKPEVIFELNELPKTKTHPSTYPEKFRSILKHHPDHLYVFMDDSTEIDKTACAAVLNKTIKKALPTESAITTAVARAKDLALDFISKSKQEIYHHHRVALGFIIIK